MNRRIFFCDHPHSFSKFLNEVGTWPRFIVIGINFLFIGTR